MITKKIRKFEKVESEVKVPAILNLQVWDNDTLSPDDFLGSLSINLSNFPNPFATSEKVRKRRADELNENLFATDYSIRGWFPVYGNVGGVEGNKQTVRLGNLKVESLIKSSHFRENSSSNLKFFLKKKRNRIPLGLGGMDPKHCLRQSKSQKLFHKHLRNQKLFQSPRHFI